MWKIVVLAVSLVALCVALDAQSPGGGASGELWDLDRLDQIGGHKAEMLGRPQLIATPQGKAVQFDGQGDALLLEVNPLAGLQQFTVEVIFRPAAGGAKEQRFLHFQEAGSENRLLFETRLTDDNRWFLDTFIKSGDGNYTLFAERSLHPIGPWYHAAVTMDGRSMRHFVNGTEELSTPVSFTVQRAGQTSIGVRINKVHWYNGAIHQIRITPRALSPAEFLKP